MKGSINSVRILDMKAGIILTFSMKGLIKSGRTLGMKRVNLFWENSGHERVNLF